MLRPRHAGIRTLISAAALGGIGLSGGAAQAGIVPGSFTPQQHFAAYKAICHDHGGNGAAQAAAAVGDPYRLLEIEPASDGTRQFDGIDFTVSVLDNGDQRYCMVTTVVAETADLGPGMAVANPHFSKGTVGQAHDSQTYVWSVTAAREPTVYVYTIQKKDGAMLASFGIGIEKPR
jgi:hypothetical protein